MAFLGDAANFTLNGIPDDLGTAERRPGRPATREPSRCGSAGAARIAGVTSACAEGPSALDREIQRQLDLTAITGTVAPAAGKAISGASGGLAANLGGELISRVVGGIVQAIEDLVQKVVAACVELFAKVFGSLAGSTGDVLGAIKGFVGSTFSDESAVSAHAGATASSVAGAPMRQLPMCFVAPTGRLRFRFPADRCRASSRNMAKTLGFELRTMPRDAAITSRDSWIT